MTRKEGDLKKIITRHSWYSPVRSTQLVTLSCCVHGNLVIFVSFVLHSPCLSVTFVSFYQRIVLARQHCVSHSCLFPLHRSKPNARERDTSVRRARIGGGGAMEETRRQAAHDHQDITTIVKLITVSGRKFVTWIYKNIRRMWWEYTHEDEKNIISCPDVPHSSLISWQCKSSNLSGMIRVGISVDDVSIKDTSHCNMLLTHHIYRFTDIPMAKQ